MKLYRIILILGFVAWAGMGSSYAQRTTFGALITGSWTSSLNWSDGIPSESDDVIISGGLSFNCNVNGNGFCKDLSHVNFSTLNINKDYTLTIYGNLFLGRLATLTNNGRIHLFGDYYFDGIQRLETGTGGITINSSIETN